MVEIKKIVRQAFRTGYLSMTQQHQIQALLRRDYDSEDLDAWIILQRAIASGEVQRELNHRATHTQDRASNIRQAYTIAAELAYAAAMALTES